MSGLSTYPGTKDSFSDKRFKQDVNASNDMNKVQDCVKAIEDTLGVNPQGTQTDVKTLLQRCLAPDGSMRQGTSFPGSPNEGDFFYRQDQDKVYIFDGTSWDAISIVPDYAAGDILLASSDSALTIPIGDTSYTKRKSFKVPRAGTLRIKFNLESTLGTARARIYRNGSAVGTERTEAAGPGGGTEYSEDISGWNAQDEVQLYALQDVFNGIQEVKNFRIYADAVTVETAVYNT